MTMLLETPHLRLRPFAPADADLAFPWLTDAEIMRFMPTGQDFTMTQVEARIARYIAHQEQYGYSRWLAFDRTSGAAVGDAGLLYLPATQEIELGYRVIKAHWSHGLATEMAVAWLAYAFGPLDLHEIIAFSHPDNKASVRVMEKSGFHFLRHDQIAGMGVVVYGIRKPGPARD
jgi:ribosomal-protein-alanine N-acetyltransferase